MNYDIIGYVFEGEVHCPDCTCERFPKLRGTDREGNRIGAYTESDASDSDLSTVCGDCQDVLYEIEEQEKFPPLRLVHSA